MLWASRVTQHLAAIEAIFSNWLRLENDFYYGHSYIARHDERIRFNGQLNDRCAADR